MIILSVLEKKLSSERGQVHFFEKNGLISGGVNEVEKNTESDKIT